MGKIIVSGASGQFGHAAASALLDMGQDVIALSRSTGKLADLAARATQVAQGIEPEIVVAGFAALEQVIVDPSQGDVQRRLQPLEREFLQRIKQQCRILPTLAEWVVGGFGGHRAAWRRITAPYTVRRDSSQVVDLRHVSPRPVDPAIVCKG